MSETVSTQSSAETLFDSKEPLAGEQVVDFPHLQPETSSIESSGEDHDQPSKAKEDEKQQFTKYNNSDKLEQSCNTVNSSSDNETISKECNSNDVGNNKKRKMKCMDSGNNIVVEESGEPIADVPRTPSEKPDTVDNYLQDSRFTDNNRNVDEHATSTNNDKDRRTKSRKIAEVGHGDALDHGGSKAIPSSHYFVDRTSASHSSSGSGGDREKERRHHSRSSHEKNSSSHRSSRVQHTVRDPDEGKIFVGGLSWDTTDDSLHSYFSKFGKLTDSVVMKTPEGKTRGFAFVTFEDPSVVDTILAQTHYIDGKRVDPKAAIPREAQHKAEKMFIGGIPWGTTEDELRKYFSSFGMVLSVTLMVDQESNQSRGFGFITFKSANDLQNALSCQPHIIKGQTVETTRALPKNSPKEDTQPHSKKQNRSPSMTSYPQRHSSNIQSYGYRPPVSGNGYMMSQLPSFSSQPQPQPYPNPPMQSVTPYGGPVSQRHPSSQMPSSYPSSTPSTTFPLQPSIHGYSSSHNTPLPSNYPPSNYPHGSVGYPSDSGNTGYMPVSSQNNYLSSSRPSVGGQQPNYYGPTGSTMQQQRQGFYGAIPPSNAPSIQTGPGAVPISNYYSATPSYYSAMPSNEPGFQKPPSQYPLTTPPQGAAAPMAPSTYQGMTQGSTSTGFQKPMSSFYSR